MLCQLQHQLVSYWPIVTIALFALPLARLRNPFISRPALALLAACVGFSWAQWQAQQGLSQRVPTTLIGQTVLLRGEIASIPQRTQFGIRFLLHPEAGIGDMHWQPQYIQVSVYGKAPIFKAGQRWQFQARLKPVRGQINPGSFDLERWFLQQNIAATATSAKNFEALEGSSWRTGILRLRSILLDKIDRDLGDHAYIGVIKALSIGEQSQIGSEQWWRFSQTGVVHLISISGLHVTMLAALAGFLTQLIWRQIPFLLDYTSAYRAGIIAGVLLATLYFIISGCSIPTQRTIAMLAIFAIALWYQRQIPVAVVWLTALSAVVLLDPLAVLSIGFWLSFLTVGILFWACANRISPNPRWQDWLRSQWAATLGSLPLLLVIFGYFPLISPLANAIAIPLVSLLITPLTLIGLFDPSGFILQCAAQLMAYCDLVLQYLLTLPLASWQHPPPPLLMLPTALVGILILLLPAGFPTRLTGLALLIPLLTYQPEKPRHGHFRAVVLDVGQGLAVLVQTQNHALLFDTGYIGNAERVLLPAFRSFNIMQLDTLLLSHNDNDHIGGASLLLQRWPVRHLLHSLPDTHDVFKVGKTTSSRRCQAGLHWQWDGIQFDILWPAHGYTSRNDNGQSCVLRISNAHFAMLIPADIGKTEELELLSHELLTSDILLMPHHGSKSSSSIPFIQASRASYVVASAGFMNRFSHPHPTVIKRYQAENATLLNTAELGAVHFAVTNTITVKAERSIPPHYWYTSASQPEK
ncbi:DNA internalization-related competence protein ComEC/Rec2 [Chitinibacter sp. FCG-7]|uniref:DNA internalization-related competence protein ComEC/Rec2 n=1 Tax=Chitinibacter mangrovi TaxID=3153927 RepID=A0AAU7FAU7_9NEIS